MFQGALFTRDWIREGITETPQWHLIAEPELDRLWNDTRALLTEHCGRRKPTEAETEDQLVYPLLELIGWRHKSVQQNMATKGRKDTRVDEASGGFQLVTHGVWAAPVASVGPQLAPQVTASGSPTAPQFPTGVRRESRFRHAAYLPQVFAAEVQLGLRTCLLDALIWTESR